MYIAVLTPTVKSYHTGAGDAPLGAAKTSLESSKNVSMQEKLCGFIVAQDFAFKLHHKNITEQLNANFSSSSVNVSEHGDYLIFDSP